MTWFNQFPLFGGRYKALICDSIQCLAILSSQCWNRRSFENWSQFLSRVGIPNADCKIVEKCYIDQQKVQSANFRVSRIMENQGFVSNQLFPRVTNA